MGQIVLCLGVAEARRARRIKGRRMFERRARRAWSEFGGPRLDRVLQGIGRPEGGRRTVGLKHKTLWPTPAFPTIAEPDA